MKHLRLTILALSFNSLYLAAQSGTDSNYCWNNTNTITTAWNSTAGGNLNTWDWTSQAPIEVFPSPSWPGVLVYPPYFSGQGYDNQNLYEYTRRDDLGLAQDVRPEQGWEIVLYDFGTPDHYENGVLIHGRGVNTPIIILYNKFTGKMKIFAAISKNNARDSNTQAMIALYFNDDYSNKMNGFFNNTAAISKSLDQLDKTRYSIAINQLRPDIYWTSQYFWFVSQFETAYDPCSCNNGINASRLSILVTTTEQDPIQAWLYGRYMDIVDPYSCDRLSSGSDGTLLSSYGTSQYFAAILVSFLTKQPEPKQYAILNEWYKMYKASIQLQGNADWNTLELSTRILHFREWVSDHHNEIKKLLGFNPNNSNLNTNTNLATYSPLSGGLLGMVNAMFSADSAASPMVYYPETRLIDDYLGNGARTLTGFFKTPGTSSFMNPMPLYNNTMGVFGLLKSPKIEYAQLNNVFHTIGVDNEQAWNVSHSNEYINIGNQHIKQYRLAEDVEYLINPQSEMNVLGIDASIVLEYPNTENLHIYNTEDFADNYAIPYHDSMGCSDANNCNDLNASIQSIERAGWVLDYASNGLERMPSGVNDKMIRFRTPYVPLEQLKNMNFMLFGEQTPKTYLKMVVSLQHRSDTTIRNTQVVSYDITPSMAQASYTGINKNIDCYVRANASPGWVYLSNPKYDHWEIQANPSDTTYGLPFANPFYTHRQDITLSSTDNTPHAGHVSFAPNTTLPDNSTFTAYNGFTIPSSVNFGQNTTLISGTPIEFPNGTVPNNVNVIINHNPAEVLFNADPNADIADLKATDAAINTLCNSYEYRSSLTYDFTNPPAITSNAISAAPNPFTDVITFNIDLENDAEVSLYIYDILGHLVKVMQEPIALREGKYTTTWDSSNLQAGVYIVVLKSNDSVSNVKIIKN